MALQRQRRVTDTPPQQGGIGHDALHKAVVAAPQYLAGVRLLHAAGGVLLGVHQHAAVVAVHHQQRLSRKDTHHHAVYVRLRRRVRHRYVSRQKGRQIRHLLQITDGQQPPDHPLDQHVLGIAVHHPQPGLPSAHLQAAAHHVKVPPHAQQVVQLGCPGLKIHHRHPPPFPV